MLQHLSQAVPGLPVIGAERECGTKCFLGIDIASLLLQQIAQD